MSHIGSYGLAYYLWCFACGALVPNSPCYFLIFLQRVNTSVFLYEKIIREEFEEHYISTVGRYIRWKVRRTSTIVRRTLKYIWCDSQTKDERKRNGQKRAASRSVSESHRPTTGVVKRPLPPLSPKIKNFRGPLINIWTAYGLAIYLAMPKRSVAAAPNISHYYILGIFEYFCRKRSAAYFWLK